MNEIFGGVTVTPINPKKFSGGGLGGIVDQTYTPGSENAQSGKAVAEAVADKMDKFGRVEISEFETILRVLTSAFEIDGNSHLRLKGGQILLEAGDGTIKFVNGKIGTNEDEFSFVSANDYMESIPIKVGEPTKPEHSATKSYVDTSIGIALNTEV